MKYGKLLSALAMTSFLPLAAPAAQLVYTAQLAPGAGIVSSGTGFATLTLDDVADTMRVQTSFSGLTGLTTAAHIHCCTAAPDTGTSGVATQTPSFVGFALGVTSGTYDHTFDMTQASSWNPAFVTSSGGTPADAFTALMAALNAGGGPSLAGEAYLNIHTSFATGGEITGFLAPVPEADSYALLAAGVPVLGLALRRRRGAA